MPIERCFFYLGSTVVETEYNAVKIAPVLINQITDILCVSDNNIQSIRNLIGWEE